MAPSSADSSRVHIYCRISSAAQEDGYGLEDQEKDCRAWAAQRSLTVASCEREIWTGTERERPQLDALIRRLQPGDIALVHRASRLSRGGVLDAFLIEDRIKEAGAKLRFVQDDLPDDPASRDLMLSIAAWKDGLDRDQIVRQTRAGIKARVDGGKPLPSHAPYGYRWLDPKVKRGSSRLLLDHATAPVVRLIFDLALAGTSLRAIVAELGRRQIPSPTGRPHWTPTTVRNILQHPVYTGDGVGFRERYTRVASGRYSRRPATADEMVPLPGIAPAIITADEHGAVRERLAHNKRHSTRNNLRAEELLLRAGFIRCGHCGRSMHGDSNTHSGWVYRCTRGGRPADACPCPSVVSRTVDGPVAAKVKSILRDPSVIERELIRRRDDGSLARELERLDKQLSALASKQGNVARAVAAIDDADASAPLLAELKRLAEQKTALETECTHLARRISDQASEDAAMRDLATRCHQVGRNVDTMSYADMRLALQWLGVHVVVWKADSTDDDGQPRPRWELAMEPLDRDPVVSNATRATFRRRR